MSADVNCEILVAAASDLSPLEANLRSAIPNCQINITFGSSGNLSRQIANGAPFDIFLSASHTFTDPLLKAKKATNPTSYATGRIGIWSKAGLRNPADAKTIVIANPQFAPYGLAAKQFLERTGQWKANEQKIVYAENVRQTMQFAETGNADLAITSWTLIKDRGGILIEEKWHDPLIQVAVLLTTKGAPILKWLTTPQAQQLLKSHGLNPPRKLSP